MPAFKSISFGNADAGTAQPRRRAIYRPPGVSVAEALPMAGEFAERVHDTGDEAAGRRSLQVFLKDAGQETPHEITSPNRPELVPGPKISGTAAEPTLLANSVIIQEGSHAIPIFGSRSAVDVDSADRSLPDPDRLTPTSDFRDSRRTLESVTRSYQVGDPATMSARLRAIARAFGTVGL